MGPLAASRAWGRQHTKIGFGGEFLWLQWGRALSRAAEGSTGAIYRRSSIRLQWGRGSVEPRKGPSAGRIRRRPGSKLQWGRGSSRLREGSTAACPSLAVFLLQWGRGSSRAAERNHTNNYYTHRYYASMGPRLQSPSRWKGCTLIYRLRREYRFEWGRAPGVERAKGAAGAAALGAKSGLQWGRGACSPGAAERVTDRPEPGATATSFNGSRGSSRAAEARARPIACGCRRVGFNGAAAQSSRGRLNEIEAREKK